ncbi:MAG: hypothetical protein ABID04_00795, partial [Patescibacteria group bacterium]
MATVVLTAGAKIGLDAAGFDPLKAFVTPQNPITSHNPDLKPRPPSEWSLGPAPGVERSAHIAKPEKPSEQPKEPVFETRYVNKNMIVFKNGTPFKCVLENGEEIAFDYEKMLTIEKTATEPEVLVVQVASQKRGVDFEPTEDRPRTFEKQADTMTTEQLLQRGIEIVNPPSGEDGDAIELSIRAGAFKKGELLDQYTVGGKYKLKIVVVDGPLVSSSYMQDPRYKEFLKLPEIAKVQGDVEQYRAKQIQFWQEELEKKRIELALALETYPSNSEYVSSIYSSIDTFKTE